MIHSYISTKVIKLLSLLQQHPFTFRNARL